MVWGTPSCPLFDFSFQNLDASVRRGDASASFVQKAAKCRMLLGSCGMIRFRGSGKGPPTSGSRSPVGLLVVQHHPKGGRFLGISEP